MNQIFDNGFYIQLLGFVALAFSFSVFQTNRRHRMLILQIMASLIWSVHFLLLGAPTGSAMNILISLRNFIYYKVGKKRNIVIPLALAGLIVLAAAVTWQGMRSLLPLGGALIGTVAFWQIKTRHIRLIMFSSSGFWLIYNILSTSYAGMTADIVVLSSILIGIYRFDIKKSKKMRKKRPLLRSRKAF